jgi:HlyD family secretion protein
MKATFKKIILYTLGIGILAIGAYYYFRKKETNSIKIDTTVVSKGDISNAVTATGTIKPVKQVDVGTQVSGVVKKIYVDYNSKVKAGQLIAELDKINLLASVNEAKVNLNTAVIQYQYLKKIYERQKGLYEDKNISELDYETAQYNFENAENAVSQSKTNLQRAETNLGYANIYSPIDGVVLLNGVNVGQTVAASFSTPTLFTIAQDLKNMQVEANVDEADIGNVKAGQRVDFTVDAYPNETFKGKVTQVRLNALVTTNVVTYTVVVKADNPDLKLLPGLTATISIYTFEIKDVLMAEVSGINFKPDRDLLEKYMESKGIKRPEHGMKGKGEKDGKKFKTDGDDTHKRVWIKNGDSIRPVSITIGRTDGINVEILKGLKVGDTLVTNIREELPASQSAGAAKSPFMPAPQRRRRQ